MRRVAVLALLLAWIAPAEAAKLYISEYAQVGVARGEVAQIAREPSFVEQAVDFTAGVTQSAAFGSATTFVRIMCDTRCSVRFGSNPTATTSHKALAADAPEYFGVNAGDKVSVIANP